MLDTIIMPQHNALLALSSQLFLFPLSGNSFLPALTFHRQYQQGREKIPGSNIIPHHSIVNKCASNSVSSSSEVSVRAKRSLSTEKIPSESVTLSLQDQLLEDERIARQKRLGVAKQRIRKSVLRDNRIAILEVKLIEQENVGGSTNTDTIIFAAELAELHELRKDRAEFQEQYDPITFTEGHLEFKRMHNDALIALSRYCQMERDRLHRSYSYNYATEKGEADPINIFFLDGPDGGTANALIDRGNFDPSQCFVANRHLSSCEALGISGGGPLPDENVVYSTAAEALTEINTLVGISSDDDDLAEKASTITTTKFGEAGSFSDVDFGAYYFDGCGGFTPHLVGMLSAALLREECNVSSGEVSACGKNPIAIGYSLLGGSKDILEKELVVSQALTAIAKRRGMRMVHALDEPARYGVSSAVKKIGGAGGGGTFTTWVVLEADC